MVNISSFLSARLFLAPRLVDGRIYFLSNLSGRLSLYVMDYSGSVPEPLLPPHLALQNPDFVGGVPYFVYPRLGKIVIMLDKDGDELYQPVEIPITGGFPQPCFNNFFAGSQVHMLGCELESSKVYFVAESQSQSLITTYQADFASGEVTKMYENTYAAYPSGHSLGRDRVALTEGYTDGDIVLRLWDQAGGSVSLLLGKPLDQRAPGEQVPLTGIGEAYFVNRDQGLLFSCALFSDAYSPAYLDLTAPAQPQPVAVEGIRHRGQGELSGIYHLEGERFAVNYNIDGCTWLYEGFFDSTRRSLVLQHVLCGRGRLSGGKLESFAYEPASDRFVLSFSTATQPCQIYTLEGVHRRKVIQHTRERVLGIEPGLLSGGEDASFKSFDGLRISARLYLPAPALGFNGPRPLVYYVHGGPQSQERPDFAWFSMPLIQYLTLNGFAVFVPNVRGSTGYGLDYAKRVDQDWGGKDRLDHVHAMRRLARDKRLDTRRAGVVGRSYGGYMTLTLAARHPGLWKAAVDMFGPFNLLTFLERIPETWKPYYDVALGHPQRDRDFLLERSPQTYMDQLACPLLVIQGKNDPRVKEPESRDLVEYLRKAGKQVQYLMFENEGHDVLKYENRVKCYNEITEFFRKYLEP